MEDGIVTFMGSLALGATIFAIVLGLGKKYKDEDQQKLMDESVNGMLKVKRDEITKNLEKYLNLLQNSHIQSIGIINQDDEIEAVILPIDEFERMKEIANVEKREQATYIGFKK